MMLNSKPLRIIQRIAGPGTCPGPGDSVIDENGQSWRVISDTEANNTASGTRVVHIGKIRDGMIW